MQKYALASFPTPILNRADFSYVFGGCERGILLDENGLLRPLEMIAFKHDLFEVKEQVSEHIIKVSHPLYPSQSPLFIDARFVQFIDKAPLKKKKEMPSAAVILTRLKQMLHLPYVWGGNYSKGISKMQEFYPFPVKQKLTEKQKANWLFKGVDCSGMLFEATEGATPRNTSWMREMGVCVDIENKSGEQIEKLLKPLDAILWNTHVLFVLDNGFTIEARARQGCVFITPILKRLSEIFEEEKKIPMNSTKDPYFIEKGFSVIRFHPESF